jgi:mannosyltransferase OCH1-like enzyme
MVETAKPGSMGAIPKIVHFIWLQGAEHLQLHRPSYWENVQRTKSIFGQLWEIKLWDAAAIEALIRTDAPSVLSRFLELDRAAMKADIARVVILRRYGGIYLDTDFFVKQSLEPLCHLTDGPYVALRHIPLGSFVHSLLNNSLSSKPESLQNYILISSPQHPVWDLFIEHVADFRARRPLEHPVLYYIRFTSLNAVGRAVHRYTEESPRPLPTLFITHLTDFYGRHAGNGEWAGWLGTFGPTRDIIEESLNWICAVSLLINLALILVVAALVIAMN